MSGLPRRDKFGRLACYYYINAAMKWPLELVARQPVRIFNPPLICLSHPALSKKVVPRRGDAPRSAGYRPAALLLSYGGNENEMAEHQRIALWTPLRGAAVFETVSSSMPDVLL